MWPLCHNAFIEPTFNQADWETYTAVNRSFARHVIEEIGRWPSCRVHPGLPLGAVAALPPGRRPRCDYRTVLAHSMAELRGFPYLPLAGGAAGRVAGNDMLGFHIGDHRNNFMEAASRILGARVHESTTWFTIGMIPPWCGPCRSAWISSNWKSRLRAPRWPMRWSGWVAEWDLEDK